MFFVAHFAFAILLLVVPGNELISYAQPFEYGHAQTESKSNSETTDRSSVEADAHLSRSRKAPIRLNKIFVKTIAVPTLADTDLSAKRFGSFSRTGFSPTQPSVFRNLPLII